ncbi:hypothetical protein HYV22_03680 [Candidatus Gottesmanbacteria bacterium]|nr:hypothetical protein [Candidatus Gottesmanbacteria bacterium]
MKHRIALLSAFFAIFVFILPQLTTKAYAAAWFMSDPQSFGQTLQNAEQSNQVQKEGYDMSTQVNMMNSLVCLISGCSRNPQSSLHYSKSALAGIGGYITAMYTTPAASTYLAVRDIGHSLGFIPETVYAQGVGFSSLAPLLPVWKVFRNIAYVLLAIVMIVIGFMVMFRRKIDPKTVVTVQNALPRIVITLLLITFSYAIVGVLIDLMYIVMAFAYALLQTTGHLKEGQVSLFVGGYQSTKDVILSGNLGQVFHLLFPSNLLDLYSLSFVILGGTENLLQGILAGIGSVLGLVLLIFALLFIFIRLFLMFLSAYVNIVLSLIFGPIQILVGAVPGMDGFSGWIKNLISNLAVFPIAGVMFMLAMVFADIANQPSQTFWAPPYYTLATQTTSAISALFMIGILMIIPGMANSLKKALKAQAALPIGAPIGQAIGVGWGGIQLLGTHWLQQRAIRHAVAGRSEPAKPVAGPRT